MRRSPPSRGRRRRRRRSLRLLVFAELVAHDAADLADRRALLERGADRFEQVARALRDLSQLLEPRRDLLLVAIGLELLQPVDLLALGLRVDAQDLYVVGLV